MIENSSKIRRVKFASRDGLSSPRLGGGVVDVNVRRVGTVGVQDIDGVGELQKWTRIMSVQTCRIKIERERNLSKR